MTKSNIYITFYLMLIVSLGYVATDIYVPALPALVTYFKTNDDEVQRTLFSFLIAFSLSPLFFGPLSDHIGRKKVLNIGIFIGILTTIGALFAEYIHALIFWRLLQGIGMGAVLISARAIVLDLYTGKALAHQMSLITMLLPIILSIAPIVGGFLEETWNWQAIFIFLALYMIVILIPTMSMSETLKNTSHTKFRQILKIYRSHANNRPFILFSINAALPCAGIFAFWTTTPFLFQEIIGLTPLEYGFLALYIGVTICLTSMVNTQLIKRFSLPKIIMIGSVIALLSGILLLIVHFGNILNKWSLLVPCLLYFMCIPLCLANASPKAMSYVKERFGAASALLTSGQFLVGSLGSFIFSLVPDESALPLALCFILIGAGSVANLIYAEKLYPERT